MLKTEVKTASTADLVAFYNKHNKKAPVKKFADRATAEKRVTALIDEIEAVAAEAAKLASAPALPARQGKVQVANGAATLKTAAGATVRVVPAAGTKRPTAKATKAATPAHDADKTEYKLGDTSKVKRGAIYEAVTKLAKKGGAFTRPDFCKACGGEVNSLSHFYWAKRHGVVVAA
jgi:hypothetical protein